MNILCRLGWHRWEEFDLRVWTGGPMDARNPGFKAEAARECARCRQVEVYRPGLHHPPYWKVIARLTP